MLDKIERLEKPSEVKSDMKLTLTPHIQSGNDVMSVQGLSKGFDGQLLFSDVSFEIKRGEHVAIIGDNGTGKTTLLKIINELVPPDSGTIKLGSNVEIGYYDQEHHVLHMEKTLFEEISDDYPYLTNTEIRNTLAAFLFTGEDVFKKISSLSGGERGRVSLAKLMLSEANFLILDEPTNHLDIMSKEILESALNSYEGTVLYVSHDRYFINKTASRILELTQREFVNYIGNYDYYLEKKDTLSPTAVVEKVSAPTEDTAVKLDWKQQKESQALARKRENDIKKCEAKIEELENLGAELDEEMAKPEVATNSVKLQEVATKRAKLDEELSELYEKWEELSS
jgi:ATP-binding cassette subfamily F protein 3